MARSASVSVPASCVLCSKATDARAGRDHRTKWERTCQSGLPSTDSAASAATCCAPSSSPAAPTSRSSRINDLGPVETNAHLLRYDTRARPLPRHGDGQGRHHRRRQRRRSRSPPSKDPAKLPWKDLGVDIALECTGIFTAKDKAAAAPRAPAPSACWSRRPADGADLTVVYGVNHDKLTKDHMVVSNASCTTNCLAPVAKVLQRRHRHRQGLHDHDPLLHRRPADARHDAQGPLPRPRRGAVA